MANVQEEMETKLGEVIPDDLARALRTEPEMVVMWDKLRPSCQRSYVKLVTQARKPETRERRIRRVLKLTEEYYQRHSATAVLPRTDERVARP